MSTGNITSSCNNEYKSPCTKMRLDETIACRLHFFLLDLKNAEKSKPAAMRLVQSLDKALLPASYLSDSYFTLEQQQQLLSFPLPNGTSLREAFEKRFCQGNAAREPPCGPHELGPWYAHHLRLGKLTRSIKSQYIRWSYNK